VSKRRQPHRSQFDGVQVVVLDEDAYERLEAARRQAGAQANQIRSLKQKLKEVRTFLDELDQAVADLPACQDLCEGETSGAPQPGCARRAVMALLVARPDAPRAVRVVHQRGGDD
jgi:hypothetical protein